LVLGDNDRSRVFPVEIANNKTIGALKDAIKEKKKPAFDHVPADTLDLWKVSGFDSPLVRSCPLAPFFRYPFQSKQISSRKSASWP
jgi:hypothetical protein